MAKVVDGMCSAHEANRVEERWKNVKYDEHGGIKEQLQEDARPN